MERIMISYPEFYKHLDLLYEKRLDYENYNNYIKSFKERMTEDELVYYLLSSISCFIKSYNNQGFLYILGVVMIFIIKALEKINPEKYKNLKSPKTFLVSKTFNSQQEAQDWILDRFLGRILTFKKNGKNINFIF